MVKFIYRSRNDEDYLIILTNKTKALGLMVKTLFYIGCYKTMTKDNLEYLANFPKEIKIPIHDTTITIMHSSKLYFNKTILDEFTSKNYAINYRKKPFTHEEYLNYINVTLNNDINL